ELTSEPPDVTAARVGALMQIVATEPTAARQGLAKCLGDMKHADATRALAKLAIFSLEPEVRHAAREALKNCAKSGSTEILLQGLLYPWPAVAQNAAKAAVELQRKDLLPQLVDLLDEPDPREPVVSQINRKQVPVVREVVRINHLRNCLLCHPPATASRF